MPVRKILLNKFFNDFYDTPLRQPLCRYLCTCVYIVAAEILLRTHTHTNTHAMHDVACDVYEDESETRQRPTRSTELYVLKSLAL